MVKENPLETHPAGFDIAPSGRTFPPALPNRGRHRQKGILMGYGIGGILILILVILAIIYFAKRV